jgi:poly(3-hydroxybutyrate) depolymerase
MKRLAGVLLLLSLTTAAQAAKIQKRTLTSGGVSRTYSLYVPDTLPKDARVPLLVTLHGSGRDGSVILEKWRGLADKEGIILVGPDSKNSQMWQAPEDGPVFLRDVVEEVKSSFPIDPRRVYLFGHSAGACFAFQMGLLESDYYAAAAIHAGVMRLQDDVLFQYANRKIPFTLFIGADDTLFPVADVKRTRDALLERGFIAEYTEIPHHDHNYYVLAGDINPKVWRFLKQYSLPGEPKFVEYREK